MKNLVKTLYDNHTYRLKVVRLKTIFSLPISKYVVTQKNKQRQLAFF